ncbi:MAG: TrbI/VirB10 family protein [Acidobacteria bacterium]|nr:TrbI/VirB10 family protein [Acidobacteriota bacterium]
MEPIESVTTEISEESQIPRKKRVWVYAAIGGVILAVGLLALLLATRNDQQAVGPALTVEDLEQQKYDAQQKENEKNKAAQLRNDLFLLRKDENTDSQLSLLMNQLQKNDSSALSQTDAKQVRAEEEAITQVIRDSRPPANSVCEAQPASRANSEARSNTSRGGDQPMFVYSRSFGGARYLDQPMKTGGSPAPKPESQPREAVAKTAPSAAAEKTGGGELDKGSQSGKSQKPSIVYTSHPPVTLFEGECIDAVLVNRIIADTEPSPVVCQISKDIFDNSGRYVIFPANSRIVGFSQVVNYKGAHRLFVTFHRIILPNGPSVDFPGSQKALQALDQTGALGVVSHINRHWFLQFGTAIFFGVLDGLAGAAQRRSEVFSQSSIIIDRTSRNFERILENIMAQYSSIVPTITVHQGHRMKIYLSDDVEISPYAPIQERSYYADR